MSQHDHTAPDHDGEPWHDHSRDLTFVKRRRDLLKKGLGMLAFASASQVGTVLVKGATLTTATPAETQGPYWVDEKLNRSDIRADSSGTYGSAAGLPLRLTVGVSKLAGGKATPVSGAWVDLWHCDAYGQYSDEAAGMGNANTKGKNYLRGYQVTSGHGLVNFTTVYPGWYTSRTPHIHARVRQFSGTTTTTNFTTQFFFTESVTNYVYANVAPYSARNNRDTTNATDSVYKTVTSSVGSTSAAPDGTKLMLRMSDNGTYAIGSFNIVLI